MHVTRRYALTVSTIVLIIALICMAFAILYVHFSPNPKLMSLGDYKSPVPITNKVAGVDGPAVKAGDILIMRPYRCINNGKVVPVLSTHVFVKVDPKTPPQFFIEDQQVPRSRQPGCTNTDIPISLPPEITPGKWRIEGVDRIAETGAQRRYSTEVFTVVP